MSDISERVKGSAAWRFAAASWHRILERVPAAYCSWQVWREPRLLMVHEGTGLVIEGFEGSGNSFARSAFIWSNPGIDVASHVHSPAHVLRALRLKKPVLVTIREPVDAVSSHMKRVGSTDVRRELKRYDRFYRRLLPHSSSLAVATFERITHELGDVIADVNAHFGTSFAPFPHTDVAAVQEVFATLGYGEVSRALERPSVRRRDRGQRSDGLAESIRQPAFERDLRRCREVYSILAAASDHFRGSG